MDNKKKIAIGITIFVLLSVIALIVLLLLLFQEKGKVTVYWYLGPVDSIYHLEGSVKGDDYDTIFTKLPKSGDVEKKFETVGLAYGEDAEGFWYFSVTPEIRKKVSYYTGFELGEDVFQRHTFTMLVDNGITEIRMHTELAPLQCSYTVENGEGVVTGLSDRYGSTLTDKRKACSIQSPPIGMSFPEDKVTVHVGVVLLREYYKGYPVRKIADGAFKEYEIMGIYSKTITHIGKESFKNCKRLEYVGLPSLITEIGQNAFEGCPSDMVVCFNGNETNWENLYQNSQSGNNSLFNSIVYSFSNLNYAHNYIYCFGATWRENVAYEDDGKLHLRNIIYYDKLKEYGSLLYCKTDNNCTYYCRDKNAAIVVEFNQESKTVSIPDTIGGCKVTSIYKNCFKDSDIESFKFGNNLVNIGKNAFENCRKLSKIYAPSLTAWLNLKPENEKANPNYDTINEVNFYINNSKITQLEISNDIQILRAHCLDWLNLTSVVIPTSITTIENQSTIFDDVYYRGNEAQWNRITFTDPNENFVGICTMHYNYT